MRKSIIIDFDNVKTKLLFHSVPTKENPLFHILNNDLVLVEEQVRNQKPIVQLVNILNKV